VLFLSPHPLPWVSKRIPLFLALEEPLQTTHLADAPKQRSVREARASSRRAARLACYDLWCLFASPLRLWYMAATVRAAASQLLAFVRACNGMCVVHAFTQPPPHPTPPTPSHERARAQNERARTMRTRTPRAHTAHIQRAHAYKCARAQHSYPTDPTLPAGVLVISTWACILTLSPTQGCAMSKCVMRASFTPFERNADTLRWLLGQKVEHILGPACSSRFRLSVPRANCCLASH